MLRFQSAILFLALALFIAAIQQNGRADDRPNVLIVVADDCTFNDLPLYGGENAKTPNIDALAKEGLTFNRAFLCSSMCQPCRSELYSGLYPLGNGCAWNHSASRPGVKSLPHYLGDAGYRVGLAGKVHVRPKSVFPFEHVPGFDKSCVRSPTQPHKLAGISEFMVRNGKQPFCLVVALVDPHIPWVMGDPSQYPAGKISLPPHLADTADTRDALSRYYAEITYMDGQVGEILQLLKNNGLENDTLVMFTSEQGAQFPGCKWTNWNTGVHTALIARWPGQIAAGKRTDALVQYADVVPTVLAAAGVDASNERLDGASFLPVLLGETKTHRDFVYFMHNNVPEGPAYPIRSISDGVHHYIRNLTPDEIYIEKHVMGPVKLNRQPYWPSWVWDASTSDRSYQLVKRYTRRPAEQLFNSQQDPFELHDLADDADSQKAKQRLSHELDRWMAAQGDPGIPQDTEESLQAARKGNHRFAPPKSPQSN